MFAQTISGPTRGISIRQATAFAALFWLFTYSLLSVRTGLMLGDAFPLLSTRRFMGTSAGALTYWLVLLWIGRSRHGGAPLKSLSIIATVLPASIFVLAARLAVDRLFYDTPLPLAENLRWVLVWASYFGMWVCAALAFELQRGAGWTVPDVRSRARSRAAPVADIAAEAEAYAWLVQIAAEELRGLPTGDRRLLVDRLISRLGHEDAESIDPDRQVRADLVWRIVARLND